MRCFLSCLAAVLCCFVLGAETIDWSEAPEVQAGVRLVKRETDQPRLQKINLMRIDLRTGGLEFTGARAIRTGASRCPTGTRRLSAPDGSAPAIFCSMPGGRQRKAGRGSI